ncbi:DET1- and DDB1-associated protein 1-like isoform X1 [Metopolophium dirhodum]|uniref:DET1- and DDB1-associated protein 1-like isoform X1 n=1 Tax=Metopolophium dirhodum TaxID=44670 RepID=UPI00298FE28B|nr:DET1- and DDB1-associated protein 1-like isoform X1 [Metopolophium dirhodum]XP_060859735.1 DET1- and DDB1-associated protein 1-like isoform X1 [Metopolophium dirhodum]
MSIAEFLDGFPSYNERNFCSFVAKNCGNKSSPVYITTKDQPSNQTIVNDNSHLLIQCLHKQWDKKNGCKKRALVETSEESGSTSRKRPRVDHI